MKASDLPERLVTRAISVLAPRSVIPGYVSIDDVCDRVQGYPRKIVRARIRSMARRGRLLVYGVQVAVNPIV